MEVYISDQKISISPQNTIGKGGEADVFKIESGQAIKIFKPPNHPDYQGQPDAQKAAADRLQEHQTKLRQFPKNLPSHVVHPKSLVTDKTGDFILGYLMSLLEGVTPLFKYGNRSFRTSSGIGNQAVVEIFRQLYQTVSQLHASGIIIGDFNDLNILISGVEAYIIDADSFQYGNFSCRMFTTRSVDPLLCDTQANSPVLIKTYTKDSDWYAFTVMLMQSLLFVGPYGGVYKPKNKTSQIPHSARPLKRISVFHPEVCYPKPALPYPVLNDGILSHFYQCFERDRRGVFPIELLNELTWSKCSNCGIEYACRTCPNCTPVRVKLSEPKVIYSRNKIDATEIFSTQGVIVTVQLQGERLAWLSWERGEFKREDGTVILTGELDCKTQFILNGESTVVSKNGQAVVLKSGQVTRRIATDSYRGRSAIACNPSGCYWLQDGQLRREGSLGSEYVGDVLQNQTQFWLGMEFGFGFYCASKLQVAFIFSTRRPGINDRVKLPHFSGGIIDATCKFSCNYCWFFVALKERDKILHEVFVIRKDGEIVAQYEAEKDSNSWLYDLEGKWAQDDFLLAPTDRGIVRLELQRDKIVEIQTFPETEPFLNSTSEVFAFSRGLYVADRQTITCLQM